MSMNQPVHHNKLHLSLKFEFNVSHETQVLKLCLAGQQWPLVTFFWQLFTVDYTCLSQTKIAVMINTTLHVVKKNCSYQQNCFSEITHYKQKFAQVCSFLCAAMTVGKLQWFVASANLQRVIRNWKTTTLNGPAPNLTKGDFEERNQTQWSDDLSCYRSALDVSQGAPFYHTHTHTHPSASRPNKCKWDTTDTSSVHSRSCTVSEARETYTSCSWPVIPGGDYSELNN